MILRHTRLRFLAPALVAIAAAVCGLAAAAGPSQPKPTSPPPELAPLPADLVRALPGL